MNLTEQPKPKQAAEEFARWTDPKSGEEFVLVPTAQYARLRAIVDGLARRAEWDDPKMDAYEQLRKKA